MPRFGKNEISFLWSLFSPFPFSLSTCFSISSFFVPDRPFYNLKASNSGNRRLLCSSEKVVQRILKRRSCGRVGRSVYVSVSFTFHPWILSFKPWMGGNKERGRASIKYQKDSPSMPVAVSFYTWSKAWQSSHPTRFLPNLLLNFYWSTWF